MKTSPKGIALIKSFEGFRANAYRDVAGVLTIGYGFTKDVQEGDTTTRAKADARLSRELRDYERGVFEATGGACTQNQFDALVSFAWNIGIAGMKRSTVIKAHKRGDFDSAARAFGLWNKSAGKVWPGLTRRRAAESALYLEPEEAATEGPAQEMPQAVEAETSVVRSPIVTGTTATVTLAGAAEAARNVKEIRDGLGDWLPWVLVACAVGVAGWVVWTRVVQRKQGWA